MGEDPNLLTMSIDDAPFVSSVPPVHSIKASSDMEELFQTDELHGYRTNTNAVVSVATPQRSPWSPSTFLSLTSILLMIVIGGRIFQKRWQNGGMSSMSGGGLMDMIVPGPCTLHRSCTSPGTVRM